MLKNIPGVIALLILFLLEGSTDAQNLNFPDKKNQPGQRFTSNPLLSEIDHPWRFVGAGVDDGKVPPGDRMKLSQATGLLSCGKMQEGIQALEAILSKPGSPEIVKAHASGYLLSACEQNNSWDKVKVLASKLIVDDSFPMRDRAYLALSKYYRHIGNTKESQKAFSLFNRYCIVGAMSATLKQGMALCQEHKTAEALKLLSNAKPDSDASAVSIWHCLAILNENEGRLEASVREYSRCIQIADLTPRWWQLRGLAELKLHRYLVAKADFRKAASLSFTRADKLLSYLGIAESEIELNQLAAASITYATSFRFADKESQYNLLMREGDLMLLQNKYLKASAYFARAKTMAPVHEKQTVIKRSRNSFLLANKLENALTDANELVRLAPDDDENLFVRSLILAKSGKFSDATSDLTEVISLTAPADCGLLFALRADDYYQKGDLSKAARDFKEAIKLVGQKPYLVHGLSLCLPHSRPATSSSAANLHSLNIESRQTSERDTESSVVQKLSSKSNLDELSTTITQRHASDEKTKNDLETIFRSKMLKPVAKQLGEQIDRKWKQLTEPQIRTTHE